MTSEPISAALYRSETGMRPDSAAAHGLLAQARARNARLGLTGFLHLEDGFFFQWLEGPPESLAEVLGDIERDRRHHSMTYLDQGTVAQRQFAGWAMHMSTREEGSIFSWLAEAPVSQHDRRDYAATVLAFLKSRQAEAA